MSEFELRRRLQALKVDRQPSRDLWTGIVGQLAQPAPAAMSAPRRTPSRAVPWALAAGLLLALGVTSVMVRREPVAPPTVAAADTRMPWTLVQARALDVTYESALRSAGGDRAMETRLAQLPPDLVAATTEIDAARVELEKALRANPDATYLLHRLRRTHEHKLRLARLGTLAT